MCKWGNIRLGNILEARDDVKVTKQQIMGGERCFIGQSLDTISFLITKK